MRTFAATALGLSLLVVASCKSSKKDEPDFLQEEAARQEAYLDDQWDRLTLAEQKRSFLVEQHIENARDMLANLRLLEAEQELHVLQEL